MTWSPARLIGLGTALALLAIATGALAAAIAGPRIPACLGAPLSEGCASGGRLAGVALGAVALGLGVWGGVLVAVGLGRRAAAEDEAHLEGGDPPSAPRDRAP